MTSGFGMQPDQYFPASTVNAGSGFSAYSQKTQADWQSEIDNSWMSTLGPLADLCALVNSLPIIKSLMTYGESFLAGNTANILHGIQLATNDLTALICTVAGDVDINAILDGANAMLAAANANWFYTELVAIGQAIEGVTGNVLIDAINGSDHWLTDIMTFLGNPLGLGTGLITGVIPALRIAGLDASKIISGMFPQNMIIDLEADLASVGGGVSTVETDLQTVIDGIWQASFGGTSIGNLPTSVKTALLNIPGANIISVLAASVIPALPAGWGKTIDGSLLAGAVAASIVTGALTSATLGAAALTAGAIPAGVTIAGSALSSAIAQANVPSLTSAWTGTVAGQVVSGALTSATIGGPNVTGLLGSAQIPSLPLGWGKTIDGSLIVGEIAAGIITGVLNQSQIPSLTSAWTGTIDGSVLRNAITTATLAGSQLSSAITNQSYIPALTSAWTGTIDGAVLRNAITTATLAGSQLSSAITNQNYIPSLTSAWTGTLNGARLAGSVAASIVSGALTGATIAGSGVTGLLGTAQIPALPAGWGKTLDASLLVNMISSTIIPPITAAMSPDLQSTIDYIFESSFGGTTTGNAPATVLTALTAIPNANVGGELGPAGIGASLTTAVDSVFRGFAQNAAAAGNSLAQLTGLGAKLSAFLGFSPQPGAGSSGGSGGWTYTPPPAGTVAAIGQTNATNIANRPTTKPTWQNIDPTLDGVFNISAIMSQSTLPVIGVAMGTNVFGFIPTPDVGPKQSVCWCGYPVAGGTTSTTVPVFYLTVYQMDTTTGALTQICSSGNIAGTVAGGSSPSFNYWNIPAGMVQTIDLGTPAPTSGTYPLSFNGQTTVTPVAYNATAATVQSALAGLSSVGAQNVRVIGPAGGPYTVTFINNMAATQPAISLNPSNLVGGQPIITNGFVTKQGNVYAVELGVEVGGGSAAAIYNLVGVQNYLPSPSVTPSRLGATRNPVAPTFDAISSGPGYVLGSGAGTFTITEPLTIGANANYVVVPIFIQQSVASPPTVLRATMAGLTGTMSGPTTVYNDGTNNWLLYCAAFPIPAGRYTGSQSVVVTCTTPATVLINAKALSYNNVNIFLTFVGTSGSGITASQSTTATIGTTVVQALASIVAATMGVINSNSHLNFPFVSGQHYSWDIGDALFGVNGTGTFTAAVNGTGNWGGAALALGGDSPPLTLPAPGASGGPAYSNSTPWFGLGGAAGITRYQPVLSEWTTAGAYSYNIPAWANYFDILMVSGGGGGGGSYVHVHSSGAIDCWGGNAGVGGQWGTAVTLTRAQMTNNFTSSVAAVNVGGGGSAGQAGYLIDGGAALSPTSGGAAGGVNVVISGYGTISIGSGGAGGTAGAVAGQFAFGGGYGPGDETYDGNTYYGGANQAAGGGGGNSPGGAGAGGYSYVSGGNTINGTPGGAGAPAAVYILAYQ